MDDIKLTETSRGKKCLIYDGYNFRIDATLKSGDISWRCARSTCKARLRTDTSGLHVISSKNSHNHDSNEQKIEAKLLRVQVKRKAFDDITARPSKVIRTELQNFPESTLEPKDLKNASLALYRQRRKEFPTLPKNRIDTHQILTELQIATSKDENFVLHNDEISGIVIFSTYTNLECMCKTVDELFVDGTFKSCPKHFYQMYSVHGCKNGNYVPLLFALLPGKSEQCYRDLWSAIITLCENRDLVLSPASIHVDFERSMLNVLQTIFATSSIDCCRFHLGQSWYRKIQNLGLSDQYKDKSCEIGKWLTSFFGLAFLSPGDVEDSFVEDIMSETPRDPRCTKFADYILDNYVSQDSRYPPYLWAAAPSINCKRTNNGPESFHGHFNAQFCSAHPNLFIFIDVLKQVQATSYIKVRALNNESTPRRVDRDKIRLLMTEYGKYTSGDISRKEFIKVVGYKFQARTDM